MIPQLLWSPSHQLKEKSNLNHFIAWLSIQKELIFVDYHSLWNWSTDQPDVFWRCIWDYFNIIHDGEIRTVLGDEAMPHSHWFEGTQLSYAEHVFRHADDSAPALLVKSEVEPLRSISWKELRTQVASLQRFMKQSGIRAGDRVAAFLPNIPEATIGFLATNSIGAVWSSCSPDFGAQSVVDRFAQTEPRILIACANYSYGGKSFNKTSVIQEILQRLPTVESVILVNGSDTDFQLAPGFLSWTTVIGHENETLTFHRVPFEHPIWILYSSGTTGAPKAITHSHGGILLEHLKYLTFHNDVKPGERFFWYTTTGWMMWNFLQSSLLCGATAVLYDGNPGYPDLNVLWELSEEAGIHHFGTSASYIISNIKENIHPGAAHDLSTLRSIGSTGSTLPPEAFEWVYKEVKSDLWLASMSGGTDVCSAFVGGNPLWPVYSGEIQCRALGCSLEAYSEEGSPLLDEVGEMVITKPMPSMPVYFWNDPEFQRYRESYFEQFPGIWRHGDWIRISPRKGVIIYGRSDATLNRGGVRIGTSEIYRAVDKVKEVKDSLMVCIEKDDGEFYMPLFVQMKEGQSLTPELAKKINQTIRMDYSPRHVPDEIIVVPDIPYTISGKKTETPVKKILMGNDASSVASAGSLRNPGALAFFVEFQKNKHPTRR